MEDHQILSVAFLGNVFSQVCSYLFDLPLLGTANAKNRKTFVHNPLLKYLMDDH
jgi:hypothetical protein